LNATETSLVDIGSVLDEAINGLGDEDRQAILLRFYERQDLRAVGEALGSSENAAQKRVTRALDQLHLLLKRRGVALSAVALGTALAGEAVTAAPASLVVNIMGTVLAGSAVGAGAAVTVTKALIMTKVKLALFGVVLVGAVTAPLVLQHQAQLRLRAENGSLRHQVEQLDQMAIENERLSNLLDAANIAQSLPTEQMREILRLRGEVGRLRQERQQMEKRVALTGSAQQPSPALDSSNNSRLAGVISFGGIDLDEVFKIYGELAQARLDIEEQVKSLPAKIRLTNTTIASREEAIRLLDNALLAQAGIIVTHPETNRVISDYTAEL